MMRAASPARIMAPYEAGADQRLLNYHFGKDPNAAQSFLNYFMKNSGVLGSPSSVTDGGKGNNATIHQSNHFHINGAKDPKAIGQEVAVRQRGTNSDIIRN